MTFNGKQPLIEDDFQWKMTFNGKQPFLAFDEGGPKMGENLRLKITFDKKLPSMEDDF